MSSRYSSTNTVSTISSFKPRTKRVCKTLKVETPDLFENAKNELEKVKKMKQLFELQKELKNKEPSTRSSISTIDTENISYLITEIPSNTISFQEHKAFFKRNIIDHEKSSRENLLNITKQLNDIFGKLDNRKSHAKVRKTSLNIDV